MVYAVFIERVGIDMWKIRLQLHGGKGGSQTTVQSYQPTAEEKRLQKQEADYSEAVAPNALYLNNKAKDLLTNSIGETQVDYNLLNKTAQNQIANAQSGVANLQNGILPSAYTQNMENTIKSGVQNSMGTLLTDLGNRGVLNSSVTDKGISDINNSASQAMSNAYTNNIALLSQLYGQQNSQATSGITAGAAAQEAAQQPALNLWNASLGLNGATTGALASIAGQGTTTATQSTSGGSGILGGILTGLASNASLFCFSGDTKIKTPEGNVKIKDIKLDDKVICPDATGADTIEVVYSRARSRNKEVKIYVSAVDAFGREHRVITTKTQPLMNEDGKFILVGEIKAGETILRHVGKVKEISEVKDGENITVYDLKVRGANNYYANGFVAKGGTNEW